LRELSDAGLLTRRVSAADPPQDQQPDNKHYSDQWHSQVGQYETAL
jgi:hypothetical protein